MSGCKGGYWGMWKRDEGCQKVKWIDIFEKVTYQIFYNLNKFFSSNHREIAQYLSKIGAYLFNKFRIPDI